MAAMSYMTDYHDHFDIQAYLNNMYKTYENEDHPVETFTGFSLNEKHKFWATIQPTSLEHGGLTLLEYGAGPTIVNLVSAAPKVDRIVLAEYTERNRNAVTSWIIGEPKAYDWTSAIEYVLNKVEGTSDAQSVPLRIQEIKQKIKSVVSCDITKEPVVDLEPVDVGKQFAVVSTTLCLTACTASVNDFKDAVAKICKLVKPGGHLFISDMLNCSFYRVGQRYFRCFPLTEKIVREAMEDAGLVAVYFVEKESDDDWDLSECDAFGGFAVFGRKQV